VFDCGGHKIGGNGNAGYNGIYLNEKSGNTIKDCVITEFGVGIYLDSSSNNDIINNEITDNSYGIYLFYSDYNKILNNKILNNNQTGITLSSCMRFFCPDGMQCAPVFINCTSGNTNSTMEWNEISNNTVGIYSENSNSTINSNYVCGNTELDFNSINWLSSTGGKNTCENPGIWDDNGTEGCTHYCLYHPCDLNHDRIYVHDWNDLMTAYKCFLGVEKDCEKIGFGDGQDIKREYLCFVDN
jgi:parallel beta-helix repeat protein